MKNRKIISLLCALTMLLASFAGITVTAEGAVHSISVVAEEASENVTVKTTEEESFSGILIYAVYNNQALISVQTEKFEGVSSTHDVLIKLDTPYTETNTKLFAWESLESMEPYTIVPLQNPVQKTALTGTPSIGSAAVYNTQLTATYTKPADAEDVTYQWQIADTDDNDSYSNISGETNSTYTPSASDVDKWIRVAVTADDDDTKYEGTLYSTGVQVAAITVTGSVAYTAGVTENKATVGTSVAATATLTPNDAAVTYKWQASEDGSINWVDINDETTSSYTPVENDKYIRIVITPNASAGYSGNDIEGAAVQVQAAVKPLISTTDASVSISGTGKVGDLLTATVEPGMSGLNAADFDITWSRDVSPALDGVTGTTYTPDKAGNYTVTATVKEDKAYQGSISPAAATAVTKKELPNTVSVAITASKTTAPANLSAAITDTDSIFTDADFDFAWTKNGEEYLGSLEGVGAGTYVVTATVKGDTYTGSVIDTVTIDAAKIDVTAVALNKTTGIEIGDTLTATVTPDGADVTYKWERSADNTEYSEIRGETDASYTVAPADLNNYIKVTVTGIGTYDGTQSDATTEKAAKATATAQIALVLDGADLKATVSNILPLEAENLFTIYTWQVSEDNITWNDDSEAPNTETYANAPTGNYYRVKAAIASDNDTYAGETVYSSGVNVPIPTYSITGTVTDGISGVKVTGGDLAVEGVTVNKTEGNNSITVSNLHAGNYTVTPLFVPEDYAVTPASVEINSLAADNATAFAFAATPKLKGKPSYEGTPTAGQTLTPTAGTINATDNITYKWYTAASADASDWTEVTGAELDGNVYTPADATFVKIVATATGYYGEVESDVITVDVAGTAYYTVSGSVDDGVKTATLSADGETTITGAIDGTTITFANAKDGVTYTLAVTEYNEGFKNASISQSSITINGANVSGITITTKAKATYDITKVGEANGNTIRITDENGIDMNPITGLYEGTRFKVVPVADDAYKATAPAVEVTGIDPAEEGIYTLTANATVTVTFTHNPVNISVPATDVEVSGTKTGEIAVAGTGITTVSTINEVAYNTELTITATPETGYDLVSITIGETTYTKTDGDNNWTADGEAGKVVLNATEDITTITASFAKKQFTVTIADTGNGSVAVTKDGNVTVNSTDKVDYGTEIIITPTADEEHGYELDNVYANNTGASDTELTKTNDAYTYTVTADTTVKATFKLKKVTVTIGTTDYEVDYNAALSTADGYDGIADAEPEDENHVFTGWTSDDGTTVITTDELKALNNITEDATYTAVFADVFVVTGFSDSDGNKVEADKAKYKAGDIVTLTVTATGGYVLKTGTLAAGTAEITTVSGTTYTFTMPAAAVTISAEFERIDWYDAENTKVILSASVDNIQTVLILDKEGNYYYMDTDTDNGFTAKEFLVELTEGEYTIIMRDTEGNVTNRTFTVEAVS